MKLPTNYTKLTPAQRRAVREQYITLQEGSCYFCHALLTEQPAPHALKFKVTPSRYPSHFFEYPVHLHHNHDTGITIGAVHCHCNAVLWEHYGE